MLKETPQSNELVKKLDVLNAFNIAYSHLQVELSQQKKTGTIDPKLAWLTRSLATARANLGMPLTKDTFSNRFKNWETGQEFEQEEGIPVESLVEFLHNQSQIANPEKRDHLLDLANKLTSPENSTAYISIPERLDPEKFHARVQQEAYFISQDERNTGSDLDNWLLAEKTIRQRRELILFAPVLVNEQPQAKSQPQPPEQIEDQSKKEAQEVIILPAQKTNQELEQQVHQEDHEEEEPHKVAKVPNKIARTGIGTRYATNPNYFFRQEREKQARSVNGQTNHQSQHEQVTITVPQSPESQRKSEGQPKKEPEILRASEPLVILEKIKPLEDKEYTTEALFSAVVGNPVKENNPYYFERVPDNFHLTPAEARAFELKEPYYLDIQITPDNKILSKSNPRVETFFGTRTEAPRFQSALRAVPESPLFAMVSICAQTPEQQAKLFKGLSQEILYIHQQDPALLMNWFEEQAKSDGINPLKIFQMSDIVQVNPQTGQLEMKKKAPNETLVSFDLSELEATWRERMRTLSSRLSKNKLHPRHLRWLNFLSYSVDLDKLLTKFKTK